MIYISHTAHWQFLGLICSFLAWILIMIATGLNDWRLWQVDDELVITSGMAWVGIWRACFFSHAFSSMETCQSLSISDSFLPTEIPVAQVLMMLGVISGLVGNVVGGMAMRLAYFSLENRKNMRLFFLLAGFLFLLTGVMCLVPLAWNMTSVFNNSSINFPADFYLPEAPVKQEVGSGIIVGTLASIMMLISGLLFLCYPLACQPLSTETLRDTKDPLHGPWAETTLAPRSDVPNGVIQGRDNPAFQNEELS